MNASAIVRDGRTACPLLIERFLRERESVWQQIGQEYRLDALIREMLVSSAAALGCYGFFMGISQGWLQALASVVKLPCLYLLTLAICLPTLYLANLLFGGRLSARQVLALVLSAITITAVFTVSFAPIAFFFLITAQSYQFFVLLNVAILALTSLVGLRFLVDGVRHINAPAPTDQVAPPESLADAPSPAAPRARPANLALLQTWLLLYAFVGTQLGWTLRPFFGTPDVPFQLFRAAEGNFYTSVVELIAHLLLG